MPQGPVGVLNNTVIFLKWWRASRGTVYYDKEEMEKLISGSVKFVGEEVAESIKQPFVLMPEETLLPWHLL